MDFIQGFDRNQLVMMDFESNVAIDSWARVVDWFIDALPIKILGFNNMQTEGRPPYKAEDLLKLFMYGYKKAFRYFVVMLKDLDLISGETIAIDSFKITAILQIDN